MTEPSGTAAPLTKFKAGYTGYTHRLHITQQRCAICYYRRFCAIIPPDAQNIVQTPEKQFITTQQPKHQNNLLLSG